jgi:hypothetical protein
LNAVRGPPRADRGALRVAAPNSGAQPRCVIDAVAGPLVNVPNADGSQTWQTIDAGTFQWQAEQVPSSCECPYQVRACLPVDLA